MVNIIVIMLGIILTLLVGVVGYLSFIYLKSKKAKKEFDNKRKELNELEKRTIELQTSSLSKEELKFEQDCLIIDAAYLDKKYGIDQYYKMLTENEKGKT